MGLPAQGFHGEGANSVADETQEPRKSTSPRKEAAELYLEPEPRPWLRERRIGGLARGLVLIFTGGALAVAAVLLLGPGWMPAFGLNVPGSSDGAEVVEPVTVPEDNRIALQAQEWGISNCLARTVFLSEFLTQGATSRWLLTRGTNDADRELFAATIVGEENASGLRGISNLYAAPVRQGGMQLPPIESTLFLAANCAEMRETVFPAFSTPIELGSEYRAGLHHRSKNGAALLVAGRRNGLRCREV